MDHLRSLYKSNPNSPKKSKRKEANEIRAKKRSELYTSTRNISPSSSSRENHSQLCPKEYQKENLKPLNPSEKLPESEKSNEKLTRQKAHVLKFLAWKAEKAKQAKIKEKLKRAPFVVSTRNYVATPEFANNINKPSFAPSHHIFRPPASLQSLEIKVIGSNSVRIINGTREETYHFLGTPKKKLQSEASTLNCYKKPNMASRAVQLKPKPVLPPIKRPNFQAETPMVQGKSVLKAAYKAGKPSEAILQISTKANQGNAFFNDITSNKRKLLTSKESSSDTKPMSVPNSAMVKTISGKTLVTTTKVTKKPINPKPKVDPKINVQEVPLKHKTNTVVLKQKSVLPPIKRPTFKAPKKSSSSISNAFMAVNGNINNRGGPPKVKLNGKSLPKTLAEAGKTSKQILETPTDANQAYPFLNIVTSTKRKSLSSKESSANSLFVEMDRLVSPVDDATTHLANGEKFHFLRYSVVQSEASEVEDEVKTKVNDDTTPEKAAGTQTPTTYLSPYVSVSRGKVGIKIEREKRNSVYMSVDKSVKEEAETTAKARHTMATIHYYRRQLKDEITRLDDQCDAWQKYKEANDNLLEDNGSDMINVTIGQTKLLTTKKLKQFGDLIDRCEDGAMGKKPLGKGDGAKPILTEDLEGFWSMVGLQIENVDKRFANLQRWKENNWKDPDEVPAKPISNFNSKKIRKVKPGSTAGPNRDLQKILRSAQAAFLRKKTANSGLNEDVILTPSKSRQVLIRNRRSRSAAATVITVNTPKVGRKSSSQTTPTGIIADTKVLPHINGFRKSMNLFKSTLLNKQEKKSPGSFKCVTPLPLARKSILKTPGSIRRRKSVIFNSPTLQFTVEDKVENESPLRNISPSKLEEQEEERTYSLRTRNIKLRDLADILIPE